VTPPGTRKVVLATNISKTCTQRRSEAAALHRSREALAPLMEGPNPDGALHHQCCLRLLDHTRTDGHLTVTLPRCGRQWQRRANVMRMTTPRDVGCSTGRGTRFRRPLALGGSYANFGSPTKIVASTRAPLENAFHCQARKKIQDRGLIWRHAVDALRPSPASVHKRLRKYESAWDPRPYMSLRTGTCKNERSQQHLRGALLLRSAAAGAACPHMRRKPSCAFAFATAGNGLTDGLLAFSMVALLKTVR
jgi:hypothetical protein